jgi:hypothetical protein
VASPLRDPAESQDELMNVVLPTTDENVKELSARYCSIFTIHDDNVKRWQRQQRQA